MNKVKKKTKEWSYHTRHTFVDCKGDIKISLNSQLYEASGVYAAITIDGNLVQTAFTPEQMMKNEKGLLKRQKEEKIKDLVLSNLITVYKDDDGFFKQKKDEK